MDRQTHKHSASIGTEVSRGNDSKFNLDETIAHLAHWLPCQGPIKDFIHHNTLHAVQDLPFHQGVALAAKIFGARSYLPIKDYQERYRQGRIKDYAINWALDRDSIPAFQKVKLRQALFAEDDNSHYPPVSLAHHGIRNAWLNQVGLELNNHVHPVLFRLLGNFLDQGISRWTLPKENESFWECIVRLSHNSLLPLYPFNHTSVQSLLQGTPEEALEICLQRIVGQESMYGQYILEMLLAHPGWSGMVRVIEENPKALLATRKISLKELIAVELICELAFLYIKKSNGFIQIKNFTLPAGTTLLNGGRPETAIPLALKVWHEAMEWSLYGELLAALKTKPSVAGMADAPVRVQGLFCIDDRECSLRRYLEELDPAIETFGAAGFFGIDFLYQGLEDAYPVAQCPATITPKHLVKETGGQADEDASDKAEKLAQLHFKSHSVFRGWLYTQTLGLGYAFKMAWDVFSPDSRLPKITKLSEVKEAHSNLHLLRENDTPTEDGCFLGFSYSEMADRAGGLLTNIGLTKNFAPLVVVVAHGSSSVNNPHFAAYDCGACSGKPGAPNARAFAWMANQPEVRRILAERGILIPEATQFAAALHNTSRDEVDYFDEHLLTFEAVSALKTFKLTMAEALACNARERCRWFELGPGTKSASVAHHHVNSRASSIFEPRPEYNHSNNLYAIVGRRELTRNLFMDRRAFLHSYDPTCDLSGNILMRILSAVIPVCGGINLEYLFSRIDNSVYGAGTKLPHNVIGLLGVANGVEGDLRTGLPQQMIEVHEPARLLIVVEQDYAIIDKTIANLGTLREWLDNDWVRLVACHPDNRKMYLFSQGNWELVELPDDLSAPSAGSSETIITGKTTTIPVHVLSRSQA